MLCIKIRHVFRQLFPICYLCFAALKLRLFWCKYWPSWSFQLFLTRLKPTLWAWPGGCVRPPLQRVHPAGLPRPCCAGEHREECFPSRGMSPEPRCSWMFGPVLSPRRAAGIPVWQGKSVCATNSQGEAGRAACGLFTDLQRLSGSLKARATGSPSSFPHTGASGAVYVVYCPQLEALSFAKVTLWNRAF